MIFFSIETTNSEAGVLLLNERVMWCIRDRDGVVGWRPKPMKNKGSFGVLLKGATGSEIGQI
jgi:hypothetical protein